MNVQESEFYKLKIEKLDYFNLITLVFKKSMATKNEWDEIFIIVDTLFGKLKTKFVLILDISNLEFPGIHILKKVAEILKKYPDNIDNYCIESSIVIPTTVFSKTIINTLFTFYSSRRPVHIKYSFDETYNSVIKTVNQFTKN